MSKTTALLELQRLHNERAARQGRVNPRNLPRLTVHGISLPADASAMDVALAWDVLADGPAGDGSHPVGYSDFVRDGLREISVYVLSLTPHEER